MRRELYPFLCGIKRRVFAAPFIVFLFADFSGPQFCSLLKPSGKHLNHFIVGSAFRLVRLSISGISSACGETSKTAARDFVKSAFGVLMQIHKNLYRPYTLARETNLRIYKRAKHSLCTWIIVYHAQKTVFRITKKAIYCMV